MTHVHGGDTAVGKHCARHGGIRGRGVKNPPILNVGTEWGEWLPSRSGCLNPGERVPVTHPTGRWESPTTDMTFRRKEKFLAYVGNWTRDRPAHNDYDILAHHTSTIGSWPYPTSSVQRGYFLGVKHLATRFRMRGAIPLFPHTPSWRGQEQLYF
jgi:hypothetical protein